MHKFLKFIFGIKLYMFRTVPLSIIRSFTLYTQPWYMSYRFADSWRAVSKPVWHVPLLCLQWKTPVNGQRNCPKHVKFYSKNKFEKFVHLVGFIIRSYIGIFIYCSSVFSYVKVYSNYGKLHWWNDRRGSYLEGIEAVRFHLASFGGGAKIYLWYLRLRVYAVAQWRKWRTLGRGLLF